MGACGCTRRLQRNGRTPSHSKVRTEEALSAQEHVQQALAKTQEDQDEYEYLSNITYFDTSTLQLLHTRFAAIDQSIVKDSRISLQEFAKAVGISSDSILVQRMFDFMDPVGMKCLTFRIFAKTMSIFSRHASIQEKLKLSFHLYDLNDDGHIDKDELKVMVKDCLIQLQPLTLTEDMIDIIIQNTLNERDKISYSEYCQLIQGNTALKKNFLLSFSLDVTKLIKYEANERKCMPMNSDSIRAKRLHHGPLEPKESKQKSLLKSMDSIHVFNQVISVNSVHDVTAIKFG